ncbi:MAG: EAL domain-containing protein [Rhizobiales bacterium]|nr:EAL domain-containing protein [Hyphomicrobiales bacterium]
MAKKISMERVSGGRVEHGREALRAESVPVGEAYGELHGDAGRGAATRRTQPGWRGIDTVVTLAMLVVALAAGLGLVAEMAMTPPVAGSIAAALFVAMLAVHMLTRRIGGLGHSVDRLETRVDLIEQNATRSTANDAAGELAEVELRAIDALDDDFLEVDEELDYDAFQPSDQGLRQPGPVLHDAQDVRTAQGDAAAPQARRADAGAASAASARLDLDDDFDSPLASARREAMRDIAHVGRSPSPGTETHAAATRPDPVLSRSPADLGAHPGESTMSHRLEPRLDVRSSQPHPQAGALHAPETRRATPRDAQAQLDEEGLPPIALPRAPVPVPTPAASRGMPVPPPPAAGRPALEANPEGPGRAALPPRPPVPSMPKAPPPPPRPVGAGPVAGQPEAPRPGHGPTEPPLARSLDDAGRTEVVIQAIRKGDLDLYLQPIVGLPDRKPAHFQVIVRVRTPSGATLTGEEFEPIARARGLMPAIDQIMLARTVQILRKLTRGGKGHRFFCTLADASVAAPGFLQEFASYLRKNPDVGPRLAIEIADDALVVGNPEVRGGLAELRELGVALAITATTDEIAHAGALAERVAARFVRVAPHVLSARSRGPAETARLVAENRMLGIDVLVDGIGDENALADVVASGISLVQGDLFSSPKPLSGDAVAGAHRAA